MTSCSKVRIFGNSKGTLPFKGHVKWRMETASTGLIGLLGVFQYRMTIAGNMRKETLIRMMILSFHDPGR